MSRRIAAATACIVTVITCSAYASEIIMLGDTGEKVLLIQERLEQLRYTDTETDGIFGEGTQRAVEDFQEMNDLLITGMVDGVTYEILMSQDAVGASQTASDTWLSESGLGELLQFDFLDGGNGLEQVEYECIEEPVMLNGLPDAYDVQWNTKEYTKFGENGFVSADVSPLSTFAADVDTASWSQIRQMILTGEEIPEDAVRIEEMLNYFRYDYKKPVPGEPFGVTMELGECPWNAETKLLLLGLQANEIEKADRKPRNFVFLIDVSGSMDEPDKLPLVKRSFQLLLEELEPTDRVSIVTYASWDEVLLEGVSAADKTRIMESINALMAGGSTNGSAGITTAYEIAEKYFIANGVNRIILATDGDLNVGTTSEGELARMVMEKKKNGVSLTALGFGGWNYKDNRMEALADYGDGNYWYIDSIYEARKALVTEGGGNFETIAKDVKLQVDFNPSMIKGYRLIGYEDRLLQAEDFADDSVDGGEIGSGHRITALYEIADKDSTFDFGAVESKYSKSETNVSDAANMEWLTLSVRAKEPNGEISKLYTYVLDSEEKAKPTENLAFAGAVAQIGMLLRDSRWKGNADYESALEALRECESVTGDVYKEELVYLTGLLQRKDS